MKNRALGIASVSLICALALAGVASAQDAAEGEEAAPWNPTISGFVDGTYNYNFNHPALGITPYHAYDAPHHSFLLNNAHLALNASNDNLAFGLEIDAGTDAVVNSYAYGSNVIDIQEGWVAYTDDAGFGLKAGKFVTYQGIEVVESPANPTISRGFIFYLAEPVSHVGAVATYRVSDEMDVALGAVNGWDTLVDNNSGKTIVGKFGLTTEQFLLTLSFLAGPEQAANNDDWRMTFDATGMYKLETVDLWFQANSGVEQGVGPGGDSAAWFGVGVQPVFHLNDEFALGSRVELFDDLDGSRSGLKQMLINLSVAPTYLPTDHIMLRAELRADISGGRDSGVDGPFVNNDGDPKGAQFQALTEAIVTF
jgi:hypothetical protein